MPVSPDYMAAAGYAPAGPYRIGALCRVFGVTPRALRYYEACGLISPGRRGVERVYTRGDYHRLRVIVGCREADLSLRQIKEVIDAYTREDHGQAQNALALSFLRGQADALKARADRLENMIQGLEDPSHATSAG
jgi:DNA-binding transcriptional MerR regulator